MPGNADIAKVAALLADPTRAGILFALSDGQALAAGNLADRLRVSRSTASNHLSKLVEHQLLSVQKQGRHRYFRLADPVIAEVLEALAECAPPAPIRSLRDSDAARALRAARMCYKHLAGALGVAVAEAMVHSALLVSVEDGYMVTGSGEEWLRALGIDWSLVRKQDGRPVFAPAHIDWSERRPHLAGAVGAALAGRLVDLGWVRRQPTSRAVRVTEEGKYGLLNRLGVSL